MSEILKPNFSKIINLEDQNIIYKKESKDDNFLITIGIPTFKRNTLERALRSVSKQTFRRFRIIISDNSGYSKETLKIVRKYSKWIPSLYLIAQEKNIGALGNLSFLLNCTSTKYFMWLADDDEISNNFLETLTKILEKESRAIAAMGSWKKILNPNQSQIIERSRNSSYIIRIIKFIAGSQNDSAFYGLHRTREIRKTKFEGYFPPNKKIISNCCYLILFDLLLKGEIIYTKECFWISHSYSDKSYHASSGLTFTGKIKILIRRINVYFLYCCKAFKYRKVILPIVFLASLLGLSRDILNAFINNLKKFILKG